MKSYQLTLKLIVAKTLCQSVCQNNYVFKLSESYLKAKLFKTESTYCDNKSFIMAKLAFITLAFIACCFAVTNAGKTFLNFYFKIFFKMHHPCIILITSSCILGGVQPRHHQQRLPGSSPKPV